MWLQFLTLINWRLFSNISRCCQFKLGKKILSRKWKLKENISLAYKKLHFSSPFLQRRHAPVPGNRLEDALLNN